MLQQSLKIKRILPAMGWIIPLLVSCSQQEMDRRIKADIATKAKEDVHFAGIHYTVENGNVNLWGSCPTPKSKGMILQKLKTIHVIKQVNDRIRIAPVSIGSSFAKKLQADSILANYPAVTAEVSDDVVTLIGKISQKDLPKLLGSFEESHTNQVSTDQLQISN